MVGILGMIGQGLSSAGQSASAFAGELATQSMKSDLEKQSMQLASDLAEGRQHRQNVETGVPYDVAAKKLNLAITGAKVNTAREALGQTPLSTDVDSAGSPATTTPPASAQPVSDSTSDSTVPTGGSPSAPVATPHENVISAMARRIGIPVEQAATMYINDPTKFFDLFSEKVKGQVVREHSDLVGTDESGKPTSLYSNKPRIAPLPSDPDARKTLGLLPDDRGFLEDGKPVVGHKDNPNAPFKDDGTANPAFQDYEKRIAGERAEAAANARSGQDIPLDDPRVVAYGKNILTGTTLPQSVPMRLRDAVNQYLADAPEGAYTPRAQQALSGSAERIRKEYLDQPGYKMVANGLPFVQRINAALKTPGSVSDQDLLDSLTKLNTVTGAVTDAQVKLVTDGKSFSDWFGVLKNKFQNGGVLSDNQRQEIKKVADNVFAEYHKSYAPVYEQVTGALKKAGIPQQFWGVPDLDKISEESLRPAAAPTAPKVGAIEDGHRFKGGNPADPKSWEAVQ